MKADSNLVQDPPSKPGQSDPAAIYSDGTYIEHNSTWHAEDSPWKARQILKLLRRNGVNPSSICEVGCGAGEILSELSNALPNSRFVGYERSPQAIALCKDKESPRLSYRMADIFESEEIYDCALCIDVFEHVEDYMGFISALRVKAKFKVFHIPLDISVLSILHSSMIRARQSAGHIHYFTQETAIATLEDCGYKIIDGFFTAPFDGLRSDLFKSKIAKIPRRILYSMSPGLTAKLLGGCSYIVLAE
jgi:hypothetical protein